MKYFKYILGILAIISLCQACQKTPVYKNDFPTTEHVFADTIPFDEIIKVGTIHKTDSFIILRDIQNNATDFFYVYSTKDFKHLYSFCTKGNGPDEYLMPTVIKNMPNNRFGIRDHATDIITTYELTDTAAVLIDSYHFPPQDGRFCWEINYISEDCYLLKRNDARASARELWNLKEKILLDTIPNSFDLAAQMGKDYHIEFDDCWISASDSTFAFAYYFINRIEYGKITGNTIQTEGYTGVNKTPDFYLFKKAGFNSKYKYNVDNNIVYYEDLALSPSYIYALYSGKPWGDTETEHSSIIEIYDKSGNPIRQLNLNHPIASFVVDENNGFIYGINPETSEGNILRFKISQNND